MRQITLQLELAALLGNDVNSTPEHVRAESNQQNPATKHMSHNVCYASNSIGVSRDIIANKRAPNKPVPVFTDLQQLRFWRRVRKGGTDECWLWTGSKSYVNPARTIFYGNHRGCKVHRIAYTLTFGPIPPELTVDHVKARGCTSTLCCNPAHLEAITMAEQVRRRDEGRETGKSVCKWGHPRPAGSYKTCPTCRQRINREQAERRRIARKTTHPPAQGASL